MSQRAVGSVVIVPSPCFNFLFGIVDRSELFGVQKLVSQSSVEALYVPVFRGFSRADEFELDAH